jgi:hypothetical protein
MEGDFMFECIFRDGGEFYRLQVDAIKRADFDYFYRCKIMPAKTTLAITTEGKLAEYLAYIEEFDVAETDDGQWIELDNGPTDVAETIGFVIQQQTAKWF